jgi:hypothetical protein
VLRAVELSTVVLGPVAPAASGGSGAVEEGAAEGIQVEAVMVVEDFRVAAVTVAAAAQAAAGDIDRDSL